MLCDQNDKKRGNTTKVLQLIIIPIAKII